MVSHWTARTSRPVNHNVINMKKSFDSISMVLGVTILLVVIGLVADILDIYYYNKFLASNELKAWLSFKNLYEYVSTYPGNILTFLGFAPYLFLLSVLYIFGLKDKKFNRL